jgi:hypothetical protein
MAITEEGYYVCDFCGEDNGKFDGETGNHPVCEENAALRARIVELEAERMPEEILQLIIDSVDGQRIATECLKLGTPEDLAEDLAPLQRALDWLTAVRDARSAKGEK